MKQFFLKKLCFFFTVGTADDSLDRSAWSVWLSKGFSNKLFLFVSIADRASFISFYFFVVVVLPELFESLSVGDFIFQGKFVHFAIVLDLIFHNCLRMIVPTRYKTSCIKLVCNVFFAIDVSLRR